MVRLTKFGLGFLAGGVLLPAAASAEELDLSGIEVVPDEELASQHGKFTWEGVTVNFGANMRTYLDQDLVLETVLQWTDQGAVTTQTVSPALTEVTAAELQNGILSTGNIQITMGTSSVFLANEGQTAFIHRTEDPIGSVLLNTGSGVNARTVVEAVLDISGFDAFRTSLNQQQLGNSITEQMITATDGALGF